MKKKKQKNYIFLFILSILLFLLFTIFEGKNIISLSWATVEATVINYTKQSYIQETKNGSYEKFFYTVNVKYTIDNNIFESEFKTSRFGSNEKDKIINIRINPKNKYDIAYGSVNYSLVLICLSLSILLFVSGIIDIHNYRK